MSRDDMALGISQNRIGEAERFDGRADLIDLALRMGTGIARIRNEFADRAVGDGQPRREASRYWFVHEQLVCTFWRVRLRGRKFRSRRQFGDVCFAPKSVLPKVAAEMALSVLAYNLTRVVNIIGVKPLIDAIAA